MSENSSAASQSNDQVPFLGTTSKEKVKKRKKSLYSPKEKYAVASAHINGESYIDIAKEIGREPIDIYHALRSEWARTLCYALSVERGEDEHEANLKWGNNRLEPKDQETK